MSRRFFRYIATHLFDKSPENKRHYPLYYLSLRDAGSFWRWWRRYRELPEHPTKSWPARYFLFDWGLFKQMVRILVIYVKDSGHSLCSTKNLSYWIQISKLSRFNSKREQWIGSLKVVSQHNWVISMQSQRCVLSRFKGGSVKRKFIALKSRT